MDTTTKPGATPAKPLSPAELYRALYDISNNQMHDWQLDEQYRKAKEALDVVERKVNRHAERRLRVMRAASVEEAEAILDENPADENLKELCTKAGGFKGLAEKGATDEQIGKVLLAKLPTYCGQYTRPGWTRGHSTRVADVVAYVDPDDSGKAIKGTALVAAVRRVMKIGKPAAPKPPAKKPAAAAKKPATKTAAAKAVPAPAPKPPAGGDDDDDAGGAGKHPSGDPNVNENGIYVRRVTKIQVPIAKSRRSRVRIDVAKGADGLYRAASQVEWDSESGSGSGVSIKNTGYATESLAVTAEATSVANRFRELLRNHDHSQAKRADHRAALAALDEFIGKRYAPPKQAETHKGGVAHRPQTWGQWAATLRGINGGIDLDANVPDWPDPGPMPKFFLEQFKAGKRPAEARDAWAKHEAGTSPAEAPKASMGEAFRAAAIGSMPEKLRREVERWSHEEKVVAIHVWKYQTTDFAIPPSQPKGMTLSAYNSVVAIVEAYVPAEKFKRRTATAAEPPGDRLAVGDRVRAVGSKKLVGRVTGIRSDCLVVHWDGHRSPEEWPLEKHVARIDDPPAAKQPPRSKGSKPGEGEPAPLAASVEALDHPQTPIDPPPPLRPETGGYYDGDRFGLKPEQLEAAMDAVAIRTPSPGEPAPKPPRVGKPFKIDDGFWAVVGASVEHHRVTYQLAAVVPEGTQVAQYDDFDELVEEHGGGKAPEEYDLWGLGVVDPQGLRWVVKSGEIYLRVPRDPAKEAQAAHDATLAGGGTFEEAINAGTAKLAAPDADVDDPNVDGRGIYVAGVETRMVQAAGATADRAKIVIRVARGADGRYRTGHVLEFPGAGLWAADSDEPVRLDGQAVEDEAYAVRARANILINKIKATPGSGPLGAWSAAQKKAYTAAVKRLEQFLETSPSVKSHRRHAMAG